MPNMIAFLSYVTITTFTPGPNNIMSMSNATRYGFRKSIFFNFGILAGFTIVMALCAFFSATLLNFLPSIKLFMTYIGASYIFWLAWKTYKSVYKSETDTTRPTNTFKAGFLLQFVNPKVILYGITTLSTFVLPNYTGISIIGAFSFSLALFAFVSTCCWALFGSIFHNLLTEHEKMINTILALLLVYCAVSLFL